MNTQTLKKWSFLGLALSVVSVVTAAIIPSTPKPVKFENCDGARVDVGQNPTCTAGAAANCHRSSVGTGNVTSGTGTTNHTTDNPITGGCE